MRYRLFFENCAVRKDDIPFSKNSQSSFLKKDSVLLDRSSYFDQITVQIIKTDYLLSPAMCHEPIDILD